jgi:hypothetical protein
LKECIDEFFIAFCFLWCPNHHPLPHLAVLCSSELVHAGSHCSMH